MLNLGDKTDEHMGGEKKRDRQTDQNRCLKIENKLRVDGGRRVGDGLDGRSVLRRTLVIINTGCCM